MSWRPFRHARAGAALVAAAAPFKYEAVCASVLVLTYAIHFSVIGRLRLLRLVFDGELHARCPLAPKNAPAAASGPR